MVLESRHTQSEPKSTARVVAQEAPVFSILAVSGNDEDLAPEQCRYKLND